MYKILQLAPVYLVLKCSVLSAGEGAGVCAGAARMGGARRAAAGPYRGADSAAEHGHRPGRALAAHSPAFSFPVFSFPVSFVPVFSFFFSLFQASFFLDDQ